VAILLLYFRDELPKPGYNSIDKALVSAVNGASPGRTTWRRAARRRAGNIVLWELLAALSDQQLITGAALAVAVYVRLADSANFSVYSFRMATATIWLSCLTHMCTLVSLRDRFREEGQGWRLVAMGTLLVLLVPLLLLANFPSFILDPALSVTCALERFSSYGPERMASFALQSVLAILVIVGGYSRRMMELYGQSDRLYRRGHWFTDLVAIREQESDEQALQAVSLIVSVADAKTNVRERARVALKVFVCLLREFGGSYLWELIWLAFYYNVTFGITSLVTTWNGLPPLSQWSLSFGQLMPGMLFLSRIIPRYSEYTGMSTASWECRGR